MNEATQENKMNADDIRNEIENLKIAQATQAAVMAGARPRRPL